MAGTGAGASVQREPFPLPLALVLGIRHGRPRQHRRASLDAVRWLLGKQEHPRTAYCSGGLYEAGAPTDQRRRIRSPPRYQYADGTELHCDLRNWFSGPPEAQGVFIFGSKGWMKVGDDKAQVFFGRKNEPGPDADRRREGRPSWTRAGALRELHRLRAVAQVGTPARRLSRRATCRSTLCHLGQHLVSSGPVGEVRRRDRAVRGDEEADRLLGRTYRAPLHAAREIMTVILVQAAGAIRSVDGRRDRYLRCA